MKKKLAALIAAISFLLLFICVTVYGDETVSLYKNDTKFTNYPEYPAEIINGEVFVPIYFFLNIPDVRYEYIQSTSGFYLTNRLSGQYLSYIPTSTQICLTDEVFVEKEFPLLNSTRYLPLQFAADALGLKVETLEGGSKIRICDTNAKLSFEELIELFDPSSVPDNPPDAPIEPDVPIVDPPVTIEPDPPEPEDKYIYLTFEDAPSENTDAILDVLKNYNIKAVFFCEKEKIYEYPETVLRIVAEGHTAALHASSESQKSLTGSLSGAVKEISAANLALQTVANTKSRLWRFPDGTGGKFIDESLWQNVLAARGYIVWDWNVDSRDWNNQNSEWDIYYYCKTGIDRNEVIYLRFTSCANTADALNLLLDYIFSNSNMHLMLIDEVTPEYNFYK